MKTKDIEEIISLCEPLALIMSELSKSDENSLTQIAKSAIKIKPVLEDFVNVNQGISQKKYLKLESSKQDFCDNVDGLVDSIDDLQDLIEDEGFDACNDIMNLEDIRTWLFRIMDYKNVKNKSAEKA